MERVWTEAYGGEWEVGYGGSEGVGELKGGFGDCEGWKEASCGMWLWEAVLGL